jgi:hypothetical protein
MEGVRVINGRRVHERNIMTHRQLESALKRSFSIVELHHESFRDVAVPLSGDHQIVVKVNDAGTHVLTHKGKWTWKLSSFISTMENVLELANKPEIKSVFRGRTRELLNRYPWGKV